MASKYPSNAFAAGTPPRTPLGEHTAIPGPPSWIREGRKWKGGEGAEGKKGLKGRTRN